MVVVQLLAAHENAPRQDVAGIVQAFEIAVAQRVADSVDHTGRPYRNPQHLYGPDPDAIDTEQQQVDDRHQHNAQAFIGGVQTTLDPVVRRPLPVAFQRLGGGRPGIELGALEQHRTEPEHHRAVGILAGFALGVMLTVNGRPRLGVLGRGQPQPEPEHVLQYRVQVQRVVGGVAVQIEGDADNGHVGHAQRYQNQLGDREVEETVEPHGAFCP